MTRSARNVWRRAVLALLLMVPVWATHAAAPADGRYIDPRNRFMLTIPPRADVAEPRDKFDLSIRSRTGYVINVQTAPADPALSLEDMRQKLEAHYLGDGKRWSEKLDARVTTLAGLPAYDAVYQGADVRTRVIIARGRQTEFVIMFFAPPESYDELLPDFLTMLASFRPAPAEMTAQPPTAAGPPSPLPPVAGKAGLVLFSEPGFGYSIMYPADWMRRRPTASRVEFSGGEGTPAYYATVSIENTRVTEAKNPAAAAAALFAVLKQQLAKDAAGVAFLGERPYRYAKNGLELDGHALLVAYGQAGQRFRQYTVVLPRPQGTVAHVWSFAAPEDRFSEFQPIAEEMLQGWTIATGG